MRILRLKIYQPNAHYRIPFTYQRRHTYPLPPFSTVIGFLCNMMGISWQGELEGAPEEYKELRELKISISGSFKTMTTEYTWLRNLSKESHDKRFRSPCNRYLGGHIEHIGGQQPVLVDVLNEVRLVIHLAHKNKEFLEKMRLSLENPEKRLDVVHLGRAEDWLVFEEISNIKDVSSDPSFEVKDGLHRNFGFHFFWIPENIYLDGHTRPSLDGFEGLEYRLTSFWKIDGFGKNPNRHGYRVFDYVRVKLNDGLVVTDQKCIFDKDMDLPIFLSDFSRQDNE